MGLAWSGRLASWVRKLPGKSGSHIRVTTPRDGENHEVIPYLNPIKAGTLSSILKRIAAHHGLAVDDLLKMLDL
jgi:hypothetical protein